MKAGYIPILVLSMFFPPLLLFIVGDMILDASKSTQRAFGGTPTRMTYPTDW